MSFLRQNNEAHCVHEADFTCACSRFTYISHWSTYQPSAFIGETCNETSLLQPRVHFLLCDIISISPVGPWTWANRVITGLNCKEPIFTFVTVVRICGGKLWKYFRKQIIGHLCELMKLHCFGSSSIFIKNVTVHLHILSKSKTKLSPNFNRTFP